MKKILPIDHQNYSRHMIHGPNRIWAETNCYSDIVIELLHSMGHEPNAALAFTLGIDFEGDQWTFFKFRHSDLFDLFGLEIEELNPWRSMLHHIEEQLNLGRPILVELDSYFLPDTAGTAYKLMHQKSTVAINEIDIKAQVMGYFHNQGYYRLEGQDFIDIFQTQGLVHDRMLPPYIEFVKPTQNKKSHSEIVACSFKLLEDQLRRLPKQNPFKLFKNKFSKDLDWLMSEPIDVFHGYSFATIRQFGACFELVTTYLKWLDENSTDKKFSEAIICFEKIVNAAKSFQFQLARSMARKKVLELSTLDTMAADWETGMNLVKSSMGME